MVRSRTTRARNLRRNATDAEQKLWRELRTLDLAVKVRRQHPVGRHIADFAIPACKLIIELDGGQHADAVEEDARRTAALNALGYRVIRFWNNDVLANIEGVLQTILSVIEKSPPSPQPSPPPGEERE